MTSDDAAGCCHVAHGCVFAQALLARAAQCECAARRQQGEVSAMDCRSPVAHHNCATLAALFKERARFALKLPPEGRPLMHAQALRLQCGGLLALREHLEQGPGDGSRAGPTSGGDVHGLVQAAQQRHGSLSELPWADLVSGMKAWVPRRRAVPPR